VLEIGAGMGSLTVVLASTGARVLAVEFDRALLVALEEVCAPYPNVRIEGVDAMHAPWDALLTGHRWTMASNLPYNVAVPLLLDLLEDVPAIERFFVMVQREVGDRLVAGPGDEGYGAVSVKVAYLSRARLERRVPPSVFWPQPAVGSALVSLERQGPPVATPKGHLFALIDRAFAERRKTMSNALRRMGLEMSEAAETLARAGIEPRARAEELSLEELARVADELPPEAFEGR
jgi:16S rRNA (adenine1518-N6/adenine1519-N6)-dimethyltransferase